MLSADNVGIGALSSTFFKVDFVLTQDEVVIAIRVAAINDLIFMMNNFLFSFTIIMQKKGKPKIGNYSNSLAS